MKLSLRSVGSTIGKAAIAAAALSGFLLLAGAPSAKANDRDDCNRRVVYSDWRYNQPVQRFRPYDRDARYWAHERREAFERQANFRHEYREHFRDYDRR